MENDTRDLSSERVPNNKVKETAAVWRDIPWERISGRGSEAMGTRVEWPTDRQLYNNFDFEDISRPRAPLSTEPTWIGPTWRQREVLASKELHI
jgi:hypothetical protein